jgi:hypothetical protein
MRAYGIRVIRVTCIRVYVYTCETCFVFSCFLPLVLALIPDHIVHLIEAQRGLDTLKMDALDVKPSFTPF